MVWEARGSAAVAAGVWAADVCGGALALGAVDCGTRASGTADDGAGAGGVALVWAQRGEAATVRRQNRKKELQSPAWMVRLRTIT